MSEVDEVTNSMQRQMAGLASAAMGVAQLTQQRRAQRARRAQQQSEQQQQSTASQLRAERELAAAQWKQAGDPQWAAAEPGQVAQAWASAVAWEHFDDRAKQARERLDGMVREWGGDPQEAASHIERGDRGALQLMLARTAQENAGHRETESKDTEATRSAGTEQANRAPITPEAAYNLADDTIGMFLEYRDTHGYDEGQARTHAMSEVHEHLNQLGHEDRGGAERVRPRQSRASSEAETQRPSARQKRSPAAPGNVYRDGAEPAQLAGMSYPNTTGQALTTAAASKRTGKGKAARKTAGPGRDSDHGRER